MPHRQLLSPSSQPAPPLIVAVEDSPLMRRWLTQHLCAAGYVVVTCAESRELFAWLVAHPETVPALFLLDLLLPSESGFLIARRLRRVPRYAQVPLLVLSRAHGPREHLLSRLLGARLLPKPCPVPVLLTTIQDLLM